MKSAFLIGSLIAGFGSATASAQATDSANVTVESTVLPVCAFSTKPQATQSIPPKSGEYNLGDLGYTCNFQGDAHLVLQLPNGTNFHNPAPGATDIAYGLRWLVPPNGDGTGYQSFAAGDLGFSWPTASAPGTETKGALMLKLNQDLPVAGTYSTTISYTVTP